ncbi:hypothetical protein, partial [Pasteurella multocida]|uniref:hypothetical protein n=1 Tax=Pasteurella multocida TaxID=747 RepID=UPI0035E45286
GYLTESFGGLLFSFAIPMFPAFVANSIGGKQAFPAGFIGGLVASQPRLVLNFDAEKLTWLATKAVPSTFFGALI